MIIRPIPSDDKLKIYLRIARLYLEDDDPVQAEVFINRASLLQNETRDEKLQIFYRVSIEIFFSSFVYVKIFDSSGMLCSYS
jgi:hypothetical protein